MAWVFRFACLQYKEADLCKCVWPHQPEEPVQRALFRHNWCNLLLLHCILRASSGCQVYRLGRCCVPNMAPAKIRRLWFSTYILIMIQSLFLQLTFQCFLLFNFFPIPAAIWYFLLSAKFLFFTWSISNRGSRREWINSCRWKMSLLPAGKAVKYNYSLICYTFLLGQS